jgi:3-hydroxyacyl-CoA dehydrogenase
MTLGGGCELVLHAARVQASAECYLGLVETSVGLIPAGGGTKEFLLRLGDARKAFELIGYSKVSGSAAEARAWGILQATDAISMNPERLIADAKGLALSSWTPSADRTNLRVGGAATYALLKTGLYLAQEGGYITEYDAVVGDKLAYVLSGGNLTGEQVVSEQYLLDLEREAFLSLCGRPETQERMRKKLGRG